ncbi:hypothetical protein [Teredinibacter turnerae]|uniref:hypothetical protein n=1 Tax=Teredinibacter turnerae TaxID=2426 RepID=UPI000490A6E2|nr:hypothetical protein [Teredinibacter turnerae]
MKVFIFIFSFLFPVSAFSCSCVDTDIREIIKDSKYIFTGRILSVAINEQAKEHYKGVVANIELTNKIKGNPTHKKVYSGFGGGDCGVIFNVGWEYIIYTNDDTVGICSRSGIYPGKENDDGYLSVVKAYLKSGKEFSPEDFFFVIPDLSCE